MVQGQRFNASCNGAQQTSGGSHGGEVVAVRKHIISTHINNDVLSEVANHFQDPLRFAARIITVKHLSVLFVTVYLWSAEGLTQRNCDILRSIDMIRKLVRLPLVCLGDFDLQLQEFLASGWLEFFDACILDPRVASTLKVSTSRVIDFGFVSKSIHQMFLELVLISDVPWGPHYGLLLGVCSRPRAINVLVQCKPKALPLDEFEQFWTQLDSDSRDRIIKRATNKAKRMLRKIKKRTGVAILGHPSTTLDQDPKVQGDFKRQAILNGELLALHSLVAEFTVLLALNVPSQSQHAYVGRA